MDLTLEQEMALLTDEEIEELEDRGVDMDDPEAIRKELEIMDEEAEDRALDSSIAQFEEEEQNREEWSF